MSKKEEIKILKDILSKISSKGAKLSGQEKKYMEKNIKKICTRCKKSKPIDEYNNQEHGKIGKGSWCRKCYNNMQKLKRDKKNLESEIFESQIRLKQIKKELNCESDTDSDSE
jgi:hypothetical protein